MKSRIEKSVAIILAFVALGAVASSCAKAELAEQDTSSRNISGISFTGCFPSVSKTDVGDAGKVTWREDDVIGVYDGTSYVAATTTSTDGSYIHFTAEVDADAESYIAVYPYGVCDETSFSADGKVSVTPSSSGQTQSAVNVGIAKVSSSSDAFAFHNVTNLVKFSTGRRDVSSVKLIATGGESIIGTMTVDPETGESTSLGSGASTLTAITDGAGTYCLAIAQDVTLASGFELQLFDDEGYYLGSVSTGNSLSAASNKVYNIGNIDSRVKPMFTYVYWAPVGDLTSVGNNLGLSVSDYPVNMFTRPSAGSQNYQVVSSDIPSGATVTYTLSGNNILGSIQKIGDVNSSTGVIQTYKYSGVKTQDCLVMASNIVVEVTLGDLKARKNVPFFLQRYNVSTDASAVSVKYSPFVLFANGKKANSLPAPVVSYTSDGTVTETSDFSLTIQANLFYTNLDGPSEHVMTGKIQASNSDSFLGRVYDLYYDKIGRSPSNYGVAWPFSTYYECGTPSMTIDEHHDASPLYIGTDGKVNIKAEGSAEHFWQDGYGYPNGVFLCTITYLLESGVDGYSMASSGSVQYQNPFAVYFNEELEY